MTAESGRLAGRVAVVSGAASGNGRAIALRLAREGAAVVCGDLREEPDPNGADSREATHELIAASGGAAAFARWDVSDGEQTSAAFALAFERFGRLDIVVANAGIALEDDGEGIGAETEETFRKHLDVNLVGTWQTCREAARRLLAQDEGGRIVTMSSIAGLVGLGGCPTGYSSTKGAIVQMTRELASQLAPHGITANVVAPAFIRTAINPDTWSDEEAAARTAAIHPMGRLGETEDVAAAVAFLASDDASWITGVTLPVDGGYTCV
ncbi:MAG TPA: SDR family NAD(P)-dependent oxidoreductase [Solirubrobacterales bacterium]|nr:SDR family NAD(P)-dependent oxidoreductase [Solirubrobacterales bacterium]